MQQRNVCLVFLRKNIRATHSTFAENHKINVKSNWEIGMWQEGCLDMVHKKYAFPLYKTRINRALIAWILSLILMKTISPFSWWEIVNNTQEFLWQLRIFSCHKSLLYLTWPATSGSNSSTVAYKSISIAPSPAITCEDGN